jgi:hypothetical protein
MSTTERVKLHPSSWLHSSPTLQTIDHVLRHMVLYCVWSDQLPDQIYTVLK